MSVYLENKKAQAIEQLVDRVAGRVPERETKLVEAFVHRYYSGVAAEDIAARSLSDLFGAAIRHWELARVRKGEKPCLRIYNPELGRDGWESTHTVLEIVCPDMPFLVDSVGMDLNRHGYTIHLMVHPIMRLSRAADGTVVQVASSDDALAREDDEAVMHVEFDRETDRRALKTLERDLGRVLDDVAMAVRDWDAMRERIKESIDSLEQAQPPVEPDEVSEACAFLRWLLDDHFTFLGYREHRLGEHEGQEVLHIVQGTGLGILRERHPRRHARSFSALPQRLRKIAHAPEVLVLTKSNSRATVHRPAYLDYIGIKRFDRSGKVVGERRFLGLYTSEAYHCNPRTIPVLRRKIRRVMEHAGLLHRGHAWEALLDIVDTYPRDELIQSSEEHLLETALGILNLQERQRVRLFVRRDTFDRYFSCLVFVPRDHYDTELRKRMQDILLEAFGGSSIDFAISLSESMLARVHFVVHTEPGADQDYNLQELEKRLADAARSWQDDLLDELVRFHGEERGNELFRRYRDALPAAYRDAYTAHNAVYDIQLMEKAARADGLQMSLYHAGGMEHGMLQLKLYRRDEAIALSTVLPMLENMGVRVLTERPYEVSPDGGGVVWIHDFGMRHSEDANLNADEIKSIFQDLLARVWEGSVENDGFNCLVLRARLDARDIVLLRACCKYLRLIGLTFSQSYIEQALANNPRITGLLVDLFHVRFDPARRSHAATRSSLIDTEIEEALDAVESLDEDRILRRFFGLIQAVLRTNYFQSDADGSHKDYLSLKLAPSLIPELPLPRPMFEIFVYSSRVEGVHLRGGKVARGGLRWSDRREDFRTEVLGLMKAQMVKNAVIVPVGAKGGFVVKKPPPGGDRSALEQEGIACYQTFIRGLLDVSDNRVGDNIVPPRDIVRYDDDDPYLVVAADKGTASFSDIANRISADYGFWLHDAFASGGSSGYDHKKMAITARGAWESVKHLFAGIGIDTQGQDFTVVGIGDMSGDVFGNGMLLSRHIKLIGAFNHLHIFLDPDPDPEQSFRERQRLFNLAGSTWADYDSRCISEGGGVYRRQAKSIALSAEARAALGSEATHLSPDELIRALLRAPVDLLWNGGIGTYVKATVETHGQVGDKGNDNVRVNGRDLRCRVVGEGGNLGMTQAGRIEYAFSGGLLNTDFIDNSGGVDCSDREVNIKIALNTVMQQRRITQKQRDRFLADMTEEVAAHVLQDNYRQARAITIGEHESRANLEWYRRLIDAFEHAGKLNRGLEGLPDNKALARRTADGQGLKRPELAVLLAYAKIVLYGEVLASDMPDDPYLSAVLGRYFPAALRKRYPQAIQEHRLRREIIATVVTNSLINRAGITFAQRLHEDTGIDVPEIVRAYMAARDIFDVPGLWNEIDALDRSVSQAAQTAMILETQRMLERASRWLLRGRHAELDIAATVTRFTPAVRQLSRVLGRLVVGAQKETIERAADAYEEQGVPRPVARRICGLDTLVAALDLSEIAAAEGIGLTTTASVYFLIGEELELPWLRERTAALPAASHWQERARTALDVEFRDLQAALAATALQGAAKRGEPGNLTQRWKARHHNAIARYQDMLGELKKTEETDASMLSVALTEVRGLVKANKPVGEQLAEDQNNTRGCER